MKNPLLNLLLNPKLQPIRHVLYFFILLFSFHYLYIYWSGSLHFYPLEEQVQHLFKYASALLFNQSIWVLNTININFTTENQTIFLNSHTAYVTVSPGCTSLKQWMHWLFIMFLFPGPWKHKSWYIPLGLVIIQFINVFRVVGLSLLMIPWPKHFHLFHDYFFKLFFYLMIFLMWVVWVEFFVLKKK